MDVCLLPDVLVLLTEVIRVNSGHEPSLCVHGNGQIIVRDVPYADHFKGVQYVVFSVHAISSSK